MKTTLLFLALATTAWAATAASTARLQRIPHAAHGNSALAVRVADVPLVFTGKIFPAGVAGDARSQAGSVLNELATVLTRTGSDLRQVVRLNVYVAADSVTAAVDAAIAARCAGALPAVTVVQSALERPGALVAIDAVAVTEKAVSAVEIIDAQAAILPAGGKLFVSGQARRAGDAAASAAQTMESLQRSLTHLGATLADVVHVKAFVTPMTEHAVFAREIVRAFAGARVPSMVLTEWVSGTPAEIELVVATRVAPKSGEPVAYLSLPDMTTSPYYSRATSVAAGTPLIFFSAIYSGDGGGVLREQWKRVFAQFGGALLEAGSSFRHLVKATYYLADHSHRDALGEIRSVYYDPARPPAASAADVRGLGRPGAVLLDMIAVPARADARDRK